MTVYADEIKKYPNEAGLYERELQWLGQTNLLDEQLRVYREAARRFPAESWRDNLARWYLRQKRDQDFADYSRELLEKLNDADAEKFLNEFMTSKIGASVTDKDAKLYVGLFSLAHQRFPHNLNFVNGLLRFYVAHEQADEWRKLASEYYFESPEIRRQFLDELSKKGELREFQQTAQIRIAEANPNDFSVLPYKLFAAETSARLSDFEQSAVLYRELNSLYPHTPEFAEELLSLARSFGQVNQKFLPEAVALGQSAADFDRSNADFRTRAGELQAESGDFDKARDEWRKIVDDNAGDHESYLTAATVFWDYFQYDDALRTIEKLRANRNDSTIYAFEAGAILEAKHDEANAVAQYVAALDGSTPAARNVQTSDRAKNRLEQLYRRDGFPAKIEAAFNQRLTAKNDDSRVILGYADFLRRVSQWNNAARILRREIARSRNAEFLTEARELSRVADDRETARFALRRLGETSANQRQAMSKTLQLAEDYADHNQSDQAAQILAKLIAEYPTNYGALSQSAELYWRINQRDRAIAVLQTGANLGKGKYKYIFSRKLADKLAAQNRLEQAALILRELLTADKLDAEVFDELAAVYVHLNKADELREILTETVAAIEAQDVDIREINDDIAAFRQKMIVALTKLKDYRAAIEQHIEIINRDADDEENVQAAIDYARRYGGAPVLLDYYQKISNQAWKNYRWNVVLAEIDEADKNWDDAARNYDAAIANQPEMIELYQSLAKVELKRDRVDAALQAFDKAVELSGNDAEIITQIVTALLQAGRKTEAEIYRQKLPEKLRPKQDFDSQLREAHAQADVDQQKSAENYRAAFAELLKNPLSGELKAHDIVGFAQVSRTTENLDRINQTLWRLRDNLTAIAAQKDSTKAGAARLRLQILDGALPNAVGNIAGKDATGDELAALSTDLQQRVDQTDRAEILQLIQNIARTGNFSNLETRILIKRKDAAFIAGNAVDYHAKLLSLLDFYTSKNDFAAILATLRFEQARDSKPADFAYARRIAEVARLLNRTEIERNALRDYFHVRNGDLVIAPDVFVARYFDLLWRDDQNELRNLAENSSPFQLQLINFLLARGAADLAHSAIDNAKLSFAWKAARHAETARALREIENCAECRFTNALQLAPIGELVKQKPAAQTAISGDDWFRLARTYGEFLSLAPNADETALQFLPAEIENHPRSAAAQARLGKWFLARREPQRALESLRLARELAPDDNQILADLGAAQFETNDKAAAVTTWRQIIADRPRPNDAEIYLQTLTEHGLQETARQDLQPVFAAFLKKSSEPSSAELKNLIVAVAQSFASDAARADYFVKMCRANSDDAVLPTVLIDENLLTGESRAAVYEILIARSKGLSDYESDYEFESELKTAFNDAAQAERQLDIAENFKIKEPDGEKLRRQKDFLELLLDARQNSRAVKLTGAIETDLQNRFARPAWLRLAKIRLQIRAGNSAAAELRRFVGIDFGAPNLERLNDAAAMLDGENQTAVSDDLRERFYARLLTLEQFDAANFGGLATVEYKRGNAVLGGQILRFGVTLTDPEQRAAATNELLNLPLLKSAAAGDADDKITAHYSPEAVATRGAAAEIAARFVDFETAIALRRELSTIAPDDAANALELARLLHESKNFDECWAVLARVVGDRNAARSSRWQAVLLMNELAANDEDSWTKIKDSTANVDDEMRTALTILESARGNQIDDAARMANESAAKFDDAFFYRFAALIAERGGQNEAAQTLLSRAFAGEVDQNFGFTADSIATTQIKLYLADNQFDAAAKIADGWLSGTKRFENPNGRLNLSELANQRESAARRDLLEKLAQTAAANNDFDRAQKFETWRRELLDTETERAAANWQIADFAQRKTAAHQTATDFAVNLKTTGE